MLGYKSPLYGRRTAQFKIRPFTCFEAREMLSGFSHEDQAVLYGITGGIPEYLSRIDSGQSLDENILNLFFDESGRLFEEPTNLLKQELREPASYHSIISAIAGGASRINEIATKTGRETSGRFVRPNSSGITRGVGESVYDTLVKPQITDFMGSVFETICQQYLFQPHIYSSLPFPVAEVGRWWGNNPVKKCQEEIDIVAIQEDFILLGECKWKNSPVDMETAKTLFERGNLFRQPYKYYYLFSKNGFTESLIHYAEKIKNVYLISYRDI